VEICTATNPLPASALTASNSSLLFANLTFPSVSPSPARATVLVARLGDRPGVGVRLPAGTLVFVVVFKTLPFARATSHAHQSSVHRSRHHTTRARRRPPPRDRAPIIHLNHAFIHSSIHPFIHPSRDRPPSSESTRIVVASSRAPRRGHPPRRRRRRRRVNVARTSRRTRCDAMDECPFVRALISIGWVFFVSFYGRVCICVSTRVVYCGSDQDDVVCFLCIYRVLASSRRLVIQSINQSRRRRDARRERATRRRRRRR